jgi:hypothetical protein
MICGDCLGEDSHGCSYLEVLVVEKKRERVIEEGDSGG